MIKAILFFTMSIVSLVGNLVAAQVSVDMKHISLDLHFDWKTRRVFGKAVLTLSPEKVSDRILLDAGNLTISSVKLNGKPMSFMYDGGDAKNGLSINVDKVYQASETVILAIDYHSNYVNETDPNNLWGSNGKGLRFFEPTPTEPKCRKQIWSNGDPEGNKYWFPCNESPYDLRTTDIRLTVQTPLTAISNGILLETNSNADGTQTYHWKMETPYPNSRTSIVVGEYVVVSKMYQDVKLNSYSYHDEVQATDDSSVRLGDMVKFFSEKTGVKYPYPEYSQVFVQELPAYIYNATATTITENMVDDYGTHADFFYLWDLTEAEALAHQWFGNYIPCRDWEDIWLSKSFAHYFSGLYDEYKNGRDEFHLYNLNWDQGIYLNDWTNGIRRPIVAKVDDVTSYTNDNYANGGSLILHMLRYQLGDDIWWKAIQLYVQSNAGKPTTTKDFQKAVNTAAVKSMDWFFDQWIYKMGHPVFEIRKQYNCKSHDLTLTVKQTQKKSAFLEQDYFQGKINIEIDGDVKEIYIDAKEINEYKFKLPAEPKLVHFDYGNIWLKEMVFEKSLTELLYQFENDSDIMGRNMAMGELAALANNEKTTSDEKEKIFKSFRKVISGDSYWRLRFIALQQLQGMAVKNPNPSKLDADTIAMLQSIIKNDMSWLKTVATSFLGTTRDVKYANIYFKGLTDTSDRVVNASAIALGRSKSPKAYDALIQLKNKPSWKSQSLISALNGLRELGDKRAADFALDALSDLNAPRWTLATPVWDFRIAAAETLYAFGMGDKAYPMILDRFKKALAINDINDTFSNVLLITKLGDARGQEIFAQLKAKFAADTNAMQAVNQYETLFNNSILKNMRKSDINPMPEYFDRYIHLTDDVELFEALETSLKELENFPIAQWESLDEKVYAPGKWTAKDILQHIIDTERVFTYRITAFSRNDPQRMLSYDEELYAKNAEANRRSICDLVEELILVRKSFIAMCRSFTEDMLLKMGKGFTGEYSVLAMGFMIPGHQRWHFRVVEEKYLPLLA